MGSINKESITLKCQRCGVRLSTAVDRAKQLCKACAQNINSQDSIIVDEVHNVCKQNPESKIGEACDNCDMKLPIVKTKISREILLLLIPVVILLIVAILYLFVLPRYNARQLALSEIKNLRAIVQAIDAEFEQDTSENIDAGYVPDENRRVVTRSFAATYSFLFAYSDKFKKTDVVYPEKDIREFVRSQANTIHSLDDIREIEVAYIDMAIKDMKESQSKFSSHTCSEIVVLLNEMNDNYLDIYKKEKSSERERFKKGNSIIVHHCHQIESKLNKFVIML